MKERAKMDKEKQIDEMARIICENTAISCYETAVEIAEELTAKDYRKASLKGKRGHGVMSCKCMDCKHNDIVTDNHDKTHLICTCAESKHFLQKVSMAFGECDFGEVDVGESEDTE
jgi:hypothetical protein